VIADTTAEHEEKDPSMHIRNLLLAFLPVVVLTGAGAAFAQGGTDVTLVIRDHKFEPAEVRVPSGQEIRITVENADATPEEFESHDLNVEKIITGGGKATLTVGPLEPGTYEFVGEFHEDMAKGKLIAE